jgi:D-arabinose 1-dehydrogenase-like Zn-dependent alcohol dehydrogenase
MAKMKAVVVPKPGANFDVVERDVPEPGPRQVRIRVRACGICHSDVITKDGLLPGIAYPRVPGHEIAGVIDEVGAGVEGWRRGQRVGVGWHGGHDGTCLPCRRGDFANCVNGKICGISYDGGYQEFMVAPLEALARVPESLSDNDVAPLMDAGVTTFNAIRHGGGMPSDLVAIQGVGGLGHLGIQFAKKFGYRVAAIGRGAGNAALAKKLGADVYVERHLDGGRSSARSDRGTTGAADLREEADSRMVGRDPHRLRGDAALRGADRRPSHDRDVPVRQGRRGLRPDAQRQGRVPRRAHDVSESPGDRSAVTTGRSPS